MHVLFPFLAWFFEFHLPEHEHPIQLSDHWGGLLLIALGIFFSFGTVTSYASFDLTRWLRVRSEDRPVTGFERFVVVAGCIAWGIYLLTKP